MRFAIVFVLLASLVACQAPAPQSPAAADAAIATIAQTRVFDGYETVAEYLARGQVIFESVNIPITKPFWKATPAGAGAWLVVYRQDVAGELYAPAWKITADGLVAPANEQARSIKLF